MVSRWSCTVARPATFVGGKRGRGPCHWPQCSTWRPRRTEVSGSGRARGGRCPLEMEEVRGWRKAVVPRPRRRPERPGSPHSRRRLERPGSPRSSRGPERPGSRVPQPGLASRDHRNPLHPPPSRPNLTTRPSGEALRACRCRTIPSVRVACRRAAGIEATGIPTGSSRRTGHPARHSAIHSRRPTTRRTLRSTLDGRTWYGSRNTEASASGLPSSGFQPGRFSAPVGNLLPGAHEGSAGPVWR